MSRLCGKDFSQQRVTDQLSKDMEEEFMVLWRATDGVEILTREMPPALKYWLELPGVDNELGVKVLRHMERQGVPVLL